MFSFDKEIIWSHRDYLKMASSIEPSNSVSGSSPAGGHWRPDPHLKSVPPHFTFGPPVPTYIQYCILKMWPPFWFLAPPAAKFWWRACSAALLYFEWSRMCRFKEICWWKLAEKQFPVSSFFLSEFIKPLLGRTTSRGKCWAAIQLPHHPEHEGVQSLSRSLD